MTFLLASVTGPQEAEIAVQHGADIVDLKDVGSAFGAVAPAVVRATVDIVARRRPGSAVAGELEMEPQTYVKVGLYPDHTGDDCIRALSLLARSTSLIGVMFADYGADEGLIALIAQSGFAGMMIDTARKTVSSITWTSPKSDISSMLRVAWPGGRACRLLGGAGHSAPLLRPDHGFDPDDRIRPT